MVFCFKFLASFRGRGGKKSKIVSDLSMRGKTPEQKKIMKYFISSGCLSVLFRISDQEFDQILTRKVRSYDIYQMALRKLNLDPDQVREIKPVFLDGYNYSDRALVRIGSDYVARASEYSLTCLLFGEAQLYRYTFLFSLISGDTWEYSEEYFYKDVTSVSMYKEVDEHKYASGCLGLDIINVNIVKPSLKLVVPGDYFVCSMREEHEPNVIGMISKLREKKQ